MAYFRGQMLRLLLSAVTQSDMFSFILINLPNYAYVTCLRNTLYFTSICKQPFFLLFFFL